MPTLNAHKKKNTLLHFFPPPTFLSMPAVGLSFSDSAVQFVEFLGREGSLSLGDYRTNSIPRGVIVNGEVEKPNELTKVVQEIKKDFDFRFVRVALPEERGYLYNTALPFDKSTDLRSGVEFTLEENVPLSLAEAVFDFEVASIDSKKKKVNVVVTAFSQNVIGGYVAVLESAGLVPLSFELEANAIARSVVEEGDDRAFVVINMKRDKAGLYIVKNGIAHFTSTIDLPHSTHAARQDNSTNTRSQDASSVQALQKLSDEVTKLISFWESHHQNTTDAVAKILLCGNVLSDALAESLVQNIGRDAEIANVWRNAFSCDEVIPDISRTESLTYAAAVGLALA